MTEGALRNGSCSTKVVYIVATSSIWGRVLIHSVGLADLECATRADDGQV
jgi:hypothetical protein